jgi:serine/threonine protein phosphatase PrpC
MTTPKSMDETRAPAAGVGRLRFRSAARTHVGVVRSLNEDKVLERPQARLWAVADGMGGHQAGDLASELIVEALSAVSGHRSGYAYLNAVCDSLQAVNRDLLDRAQALEPGSTIGATVAVLLIHDDHYACVWAGDSRVYLSRGGALERITHDHSLVQEMVDSGALSPQEAVGHRRSNVVTRAVGAGQTLMLDVLHAAIQPGDVFLICTDGLTGMVADAEIARILKALPLDAAADGLLALSLDRGARDNVSLVLVAADAD